jgi:hypothetical protein
LRQKKHAGTDAEFGGRDGCCCHRDDRVMDAVVLARQIAACRVRRGPTGGNV